MTHEIVDTLLDLFQNVNDGDDCGTPHPSTAWGPPQKETQAWREFNLLRT